MNPGPRVRTGFDLISSSLPTALAPDRLADLLVDAHGRDLARSNRRTAASLLAWAEVLDAVGWSVALRLPGATPTLNGNARKWASGLACEAVCWSAITARVNHADPAILTVPHSSLRPHETTAY